MTGSLKTPREPKDCACCGSALPLLRHYKKYVCETCLRSGSIPRRKVGADAHSMVALAVRLGYLKPIGECTCVSCGAQATDYDHRDYNKPLEVEPVCRSCNFARPPAILRRAA